MIEQQGTVMRLDGRFAQVLIGASSGCPSCDAGHGCGAGIFARMLQRKQELLKLQNTAGLKIGDRVKVGISETLFLRLLLQLYLVPLLAGLVGGLIGHYLGSRVEAGPAALDGLILLCALGATGVALWLGQRTNRTQLLSRQTLQMVAMPLDSPATECQPKMGSAVDPAMKGR